MDTTITLGSIIDGTLSSVIGAGIIYMQNKHIGITKKMVGDVLITVGQTLEAASDTNAVVNSTKK